jgi:hypothetical protein
MAILYIYVKVVRFKSGRRSVTDNLNKSEMKVTRYRQRWKKDAMGLSFAHSFLHTKNFLNIKWKQDFSTQIFEELFSRLHYKTLYNFSLIGLLPFVRNAANSSRHVHPNPELNFQKLYSVSLHGHSEHRQKVSGWTAEKSLFDFRRRQKYFLFFKTAQTAWPRGPKHPPIQWVQPAHSLAVMRLVHEANHLLCCSGPVLDWGSADC